MNKKEYSDAELLSLLEEAGYAVTYTNLKKLREGVKNGSIEVEDSAIPDEESSIEPKAQVLVDPNGSLTINSGSAEIISTPDGGIQANLYEAARVKYKNFIPFKKSQSADNLLESFLVEDCDMNTNEVILLREDTKVESLKKILSSLLKSLEGKLGALDTSIADRSRGEVTKIKELPEIQDAVTKLEAIFERDENATNESVKAIEIIIRSLLNLNKFAPEFKEAYRNKKTVLIMKYQSLILSVISAISYLLSTAIVYTGNNIAADSTANINLEYGPLLALSNFNKSVETGEFKKSISDVAMVREFYLEVPTETMSVVMEANDYISMIVNGVKNIYSNLDNNGKLANLVYKAAGMSVLVLSLRDALYTLANAKTSISDMLGNIKLFSNTNSKGGVLAKLSQFATSFKNDSEFADNIAKREISTENRTIANDVREINSQESAMQVGTEPTSMPVQSNVQKPDPSTNNYSFDF